MEATHDTQRHIEDAMASLTTRVEELGRRIREARRKLDVQAHIAAHPLVAVSAAFAVGALLGGSRRSRRARRSVEPAAGSDALIDAEAKRGIGSAIVAALGAFAMGSLKNFAMSKLAGIASDWLDRSTDRSGRSTDRSGDWSDERTFGGATASDLGF